MPAAEQLAPVSVARAYFALQALGGIAWWVAVFASGSVRVWTLGQWEPMVLVWPDLLLFVAASGLAAVWGSKTPAAVAAVWTTGMTLVLGIYALVEREAGWGVVLMSVATVGSLAAASTIWFGHLPTGWFFVGPFSFRVAGRATGTRHLRRSLAQLVAFWTTFFVLIPAVLVIVEKRLRLSWPTLDHQGVKVGWCCRVAPRECTRAVGMHNDGIAGQRNTSTGGDCPGPGCHRTVSVRSQPDGGRRRGPDRGCRPGDRLVDGARNHDCWCAGVESPDPANRGG